MLFERINTLVLEVDQAALVAQPAHLARPLRHVLLLLVGRASTSFTVCSVTADRLHALNLRLCDKRAVVASGAFSRLNRDVIYFQRLLGECEKLGLARRHSLGVGLAHVPFIETVWQSHWLLLSRLL